LCTALTFSIGVVWRADNLRLDRRTNEVGCPPVEVELVGEPGEGVPRLVSGDRPGERRLRPTGEAGGQDVGPPEDHPPDQMAGAPELLAGVRVRGSTPGPLAPPDNAEGRGHAEVTTEIVEHRAVEPAFDEAVGADQHVPTRRGHARDYRIPRLLLVHELEAGA